MSSLQDLFDKNTNLPTPPAIGIRILEAVKNEDTPLNRVAEIISADPALTAKILRVANSSFYSLPTRIDSLQKALTVLGTDAVKNIALSFAIVDGMKGESKGHFDFNHFWKRAVTAAVGAEVLSPAIDRKNDEIFVTSLLQDIGILILYLHNPARYVKVLKKKQNAHISIEEAERSIYGFDHQEVGAELLNQWGLPESIYMPVRYHHNLNGVPEAYQPTSHILYLADKTASVYHGSAQFEKINIIKTILAQEHDVDDSKSGELIDQVAERSIEILSFFEYEPGDMKPYSQILQEANDELRKLNMSYGQLLIEYKQAKEEAEQLAGQLKKANDRLRALAYRDGLTGLFNHRYFQELLGRELKRSHRYRRPCALIMCDLDHFKKINDNFGHPTGDLVLKKVAWTLTKSARNSDIVGRYGGEEFAVILPETPLQEAAILAERIREAVEQMKIVVNQARIQVTLSVGLTGYDSSVPRDGQALMVAVADKALYHSKHTGRNKLSVVAMPQAK